MSRIATNPSPAWTWSPSRTRLQKRQSPSGSEDPLLGDRPAANWHEAADGRGRIDEPRRVVVAVPSPWPVDEHEVVAAQLRPPPRLARLVRERPQARTPRLLHLRWNGVPRRRLRAGPGRIWKDVELREARPPDDVDGLLECRLVLGGEPHDDVRRQVEVVEASKPTEVSRRRVSAAHRAQDPIVAGLERHVEVARRRGRLPKSRASVNPASPSRKHPRLIPVRTTSRWPCRTRFSISASTAGARRLREAPRTSGITQKAQLKLQPSCTLTKARTRSRRASACTHPIAPTSRATASATSSLCLATTTTFAGRPFTAPPPRFAEQPVTYTRWWVRAAREAAWRDFDTASWVTQHVFTTATSAPSARSSWPSAIRRSRNAWASEWDTLQPRNRTEKVAIPAENLLAHEPIGRPPAVDSPLPVRVPGGLRGSRVEVPGGHERAHVDRRTDRLHRGEVDIREADIGARQPAAEAVAEQHVHLDAVRLDVSPRCLDGCLVVVDRSNRAEAKLRRGDREHTRAAPDVDEAARLEREKEVEAEARRRVRARPECAAGVDDDRDRIR